MYIIFINEKKNTVGIYIIIVYLQYEIRYNEILYSLDTYLLYAVTKLL